RPCGSDRSVAPLRALPRDSSVRRPRPRSRSAPPDPAPARSSTPTARHRAGTRPAAPAPAGCGSPRAARSGRPTPRRGPAKGPVREAPSDHGAVGDHAVLGHDHDAVTDVVPRAVGLLDAGAVLDPDGAADADVLVEDRALDHAVLANADRGHS